MRMLLPPIFLVIALVLSGCLESTLDLKGSASHTPSLPERYSLPQVEREKSLPREGAIYSEQTAVDLYRDSRARAIGDILLVKIVETSSGSKKASTKTERESTMSGGVASLFGLAQWVGERNRNYTPSTTSLQATLTNDFEGTGETTRDSNVTATLSARVVDVTMDGSLLIRGFREIRVNDETQHIILSGIVRTKDISQDNSILSSHIADARIEYSGTGVVSDKQHPGWFARAFDIIWPF